MENGIPCYRAGALGFQVHGPAPVFNYLRIATSSVAFFFKPLINLLCLKSAGDVLSLQMGISFVHLERRVAAGLHGRVNVDPHAAPAGDGGVPLIVKGEFLQARFS